MQACIAGRFSTGILRCVGHACMGIGGIRASSPPCGSHCPRRVHADAHFSCDLWWQAVDQHALMLRRRRGRIAHQIDARRRSRAEHGLQGGSDGKWKQAPRRNLTISCAITDLVANVASCHRHLRGSYPKSLHTQTLLKIASHVNYAGRIFADATRKFVFVVGPLKNPNRQLQRASRSPPHNYPAIVHQAECVFCAGRLFQAMHCIVAGFLIGRCISCGRPSWPFRTCVSLAAPGPCQLGLRRTQHCRVASRHIPPHCRDHRRKY